MSRAPVERRIRPTPLRAGVRPGHYPRLETLGALVDRSVGVPAWAALTLGLVGVCATSLLGWALGGGVAFTPLYALFVAVAAWFGRLRSAYLVVIVAVGGNLAADLAQPDTSVIPTPALVANGAFRVLWLCAFAYGTSLMRHLVVELRTQAVRDALTGLLNDRGLREAAATERERSVRSGRPISVVYVDVDGLKAVNDREGHAAGDALLRRFAARLEAVTRSGDWAGRLGGDEFAVVLPDTGLDGAAAMVERLASLPGPTASIGSITWTEAPPSMEVMLAEADRAMYEAKAAGAGPVVREAGGQPAPERASAEPRDGGPKPAAPPLGTVLEPTSS